MLCTVISKMYFLTGKTFVTCSIPSDEVHKELWKHIDNSDLKNIDIETLLKQFEQSIDTLLTTEDLETEEFTQPNTKKITQPSLPAKYGNWPNIDENSNLPFLKSDWPTAIDCAAQASKKPEMNEYPTVFLSPENKGFE